MKINICFVNPNACGANDYKEFKTAKEAEIFLNEALYYASRVELISSFNEQIEYNNQTKISHLMQDAKAYGTGYIEVYPIFE